MPPFGCPYSLINGGGTRVEASFDEIVQFMWGPVVEVPLEDGFDQQVQGGQVQAIRDAIIPVHQVIQDIEFLMQGAVGQQDQRN